jgi:hypothetical protein
MSGAFIDVAGPAVIGTGASGVVNVCGPCDGSEPDPMGCGLPP